MAGYLIAHDLGTTGNKATLFTTDGALVDSITYPYQTHFFNDICAEQNPLDWWKAVCESTARLLQGRDNRLVRGMAFSGQMMGCVCVDKQGQLVRDALIWADQRSTKEVEQIRSKIDDKEFYRITGHRLSPSYTLEKLMWIRNNQPELFAQIHRCLQPKDYIIYRLTGNYVTDYTDASGTNAFDLEHLCWSDRIFEAAQLSPSIMPPVFPSTHIAGEVLPDAAQECGLAPGTPVVIGGGDGCCASVGAASVEEGVAYSYLGSSAWVSLTTKEPIIDDEMRTFNWAHIVPGLYAPMGTMQAAGNSFNFVRKTMCGNLEQLAKQRNQSVYDWINSLIASAPVGANKLLFLPYLLGERSPRWNPDAKGAFIGLKMEHTQADLLRATMEGILFNLKLILNVFQKHLPVQELNLIGGLAQGEIQRRMMADIFGIDICKQNHLEQATSMGAAVTAGVGVGALKDFSAIHQFIQTEEVIHPDAIQHQAYQKFEQLFDIAYRQLEPVFSELAAV